MLRMQRNVNPKNMSEKILQGLAVVTNLFHNHGVDCIITSSIEGRHMRNTFGVNRGGAKISTEGISIQKKMLLFQGSNESLKSMDENYTFTFVQKGSPDEHFYIQYVSKEEN